MFYVTTVVGVNTKSWRILLYVSYTSTKLFSKSNKESTSESRLWKKSGLRWLVPTHIAPLTKRCQQKWRALPCWAPGQAPRTPRPTPSVSV